VVERNGWDGGHDAFYRLDTKRDGELARAEFSNSNTARASSLNSVDINRDGRITLNEWPWSHCSFDEQDLNSELPVEPRLKLRAIVRLYDVDAER
jgi:hypothetical protein